VYRSVSDILLVGGSVLQELEINILYTTAAWGPFCDLKFFYLAAELIKCSMVFCSIENAANIFQNNNKSASDELPREGLIPKPSLSQVRFILE